MLGFIGIIVVAISSPVLFIVIGSIRSIHWVNIERSSLFTSLFCLFFCLCFSLSFGTCRLLFFSWRESFAFFFCVEFLFFSFFEFTCRREISGACVFVLFLFYFFSLSTFFFMGHFAF